LKEFTEEKF